MNLHYSYGIDVECAYINYVPSSPKSVQYKDECARSCEDVGMRYRL